MRIKNLESRIKGIVIVFLLLNTFYLIPNTASAQTSSPSAGVKEKLEALKQEIASKASALKKEITQKLENKAFTGVVKAKSDNSITLASKNGTKVVSVNQDTVFEDDSGVKQTGKKVVLSQKTLKEESSIAALGDVDDTGVLVAKKVVLLPSATDQKAKIIIWGQIISISDELITIRDREAKTTSIDTTTDTTITKGNKEIDRKDLKNENFVIVTGYIQEEKDDSKVGIMETDFIFVYTQAATPTIAPEASTSATPKATLKASPTPKATVKATVKPTPKATPN